MALLGAVMQQDWTGELLFAVRGWFLPPHPGAATPRLTALSLQLGERWLTLQGDPDQAILQAQPSPFAGSEEMREIDLAVSDPYARFLHCPLYSWWILENEFGEPDGVQLAFDRHNGVQLLAAAGELAVLTVGQPIS